MFLFASFTGDKEICRLTGRLDNAPDTTVLFLINAVGRCFAGRLHIDFGYLFFNEGRDE
jgi:hypothetical protein